MRTRDEAARRSTRTLGVMKFDPSAALLVYLGAGTTGGYQPIGTEERLKAAYPRDFHAAHQSIKKYLEFSAHPLENWTSDDLAKEQGIFEQELAGAFPDLSAPALNALACRWSFSNR